MSLQKVVKLQIKSYFAECLGEIFSVLRYLPHGIVYSLGSQLRILNILISSKYCKNLTITPHFFNVFRQRLNSQGNEIQIETGHYKTKLNDQDEVIDDRIWLQMDIETSVNRSDKRNTQPSNSTFNESQLLEVLQPQTFMDVFTSQQMRRFIMISESIQFLFQSVPFIIIEIINNQMTQTWLSVDETYIPNLAIFILACIQVTFTLNIFIDLLITEDSILYLKMQDLLKYYDEQFKKGANVHPLISIPQIPSEFVFLDIKDAFLFNNINQKFKDRIKYLKYLISKQPDLFQHYITLLGQYKCNNLKRIQFDLKQNQLNDQSIDHMISKSFETLTKCEQLIDVSFDFSQNEITKAGSQKLTTYISKRFKLQNLEIIFSKNNILLQEAYESLNSFKEYLNVKETKIVWSDHYQTENILSKKSLIENESVYVLLYRGSHPLEKYKEMIDKHQSFHLDIQIDELQADLIYNFSKLKINDARYSVCSHIEDKRSFTIYSDLRKIKYEEKLKSLQHHNNISNGVFIFDLQCLLLSSKDNINSDSLERLALQLNQLQKYQAIVLDLTSFNINFDFIPSFASTFKEDSAIKKQVHLYINYESINYESVEQLLKIQNDSVNLPNSSENDRRILIFTKQKNLSESQIINMIQSFRNLKDLTSIYLNLPNIEQNGISLLSQNLEHLQSLKGLELILGNCGIKIEGINKIAQSLKNFKNLNNLGIDIEFFQLKENGVASFCQGIEELINLNRLFLRIDHGSIGNSGLVTLSKSIEKLQNIKDLILFLGANSFSIEGIQSLSHSLCTLQNLQQLSLDMNSTNIGQDGLIEILQVIQKNKLLQQFTLKAHYGSIFKSELSHNIQECLKESQLNKIVLDLFGNKITNDGFISITNGLCELKKLEDLSLLLSDCEIQTEGLDYFSSQLNKLEKLTIIDLDFRNNRLNRTSIQKISQALSEIKKLKKINLNLRNTYLTEFPFSCLVENLCILTQIETLHLDLGENEFLTSPMKNLQIKSQNITSLRFLKVVMEQSQFLNKDLDYLSNFLSQNNQLFELSINISGVYIEPERVQNLLNTFEDFNSKLIKLVLKIDQSLMNDIQYIYERLKNRKIDFQILH
ncbi:hypothetical protein TTHERM_00241980 (macronuclear) [Tetrahymena thermophila SB210]|uniref:Uncharacterized protein n=1 Tax=Tetrahymena thermophila (strain SB210) TaxID=312017 RepID=I7MME1_TETTS|nr:hypothetical protein TTHERM_00241980 [Tetrahymena thermophila SB210]EAS04677.3 hypothetical protein TTHERM_00241980 [Tetrahymena thermophila SB210]|eukprot:XP_001024922.3 hypothetical protein TTHERM_00241980 [Tetrahymena thermophila SB210]